MKVFYWNEIKKDLDKSLLIPFFEKGCGISIGSFDGLHQGHRVLISTLIENCKKMNVLSGVVSFTRPLPSYKHADDYQGDLTTLNQRLKLFEACGLDFAIIVDFNQQFASLSGVDFFELLIKSCNMRYIAEGVDFRCGYKGSTGMAAIKYFADANGIKYSFVEPVFYRKGTSEDERISSSYIRNMVLKRFLSTAEELLLRPYSLELEIKSPDFKIPRSDINQAIPACGIYNARTGDREVRVEITETHLCFSTDGSWNIPLNQVIEIVL